MAISAANWASATDPFIMALDHAYTGTLFVYPGSITLYNAEGFINQIYIDKSIQNLFWSKDGDPDKSFNASGISAVDSGPGIGDEFPTFSEYNGSGYDTMLPKDLIDDHRDSGITANIGMGSKPSGSTLYSLFAYTAYCWVLRDPAQVLFSWITHHIDSNFTLKDYLDQTSFEDASDHYDDNLGQITLFREEGRAISEQIKKVFSHFSDFLTIRPNDSTGLVKMGILPRRALAERTTAIDLDSDSVEAFTIRPTDAYTLDEISVEYGSIIATNSGGGFVYPVEFPFQSADLIRQKAGTVGGDRAVDLDCPYHVSRANVLAQLDIQHWKDDQDEIELDFADWSHFNFEVGDLVHVTGQDYDGTENFVVTEKDVDNDTLLATVRLLQLFGNEGSTARIADSGNHIAAFRPGSLGTFFDASETIPREIFLNIEPRNADRFWGENSVPIATHGQPPSNPAIQMARGTGGPAGGNPITPQINVNKKEKWPGLVWTSETGLAVDGIFTDITFPSITSHDYTFYCVVNQDSVPTVARYLLDFGGIDRLTFAISGGTSPGNIQYFESGVWRGITTGITGWQIITFVLESPSSGKIRRNGVDLSTGLSYTKRTIQGTGQQAGLGCEYTGNGNSFVGDFMECHLFRTAHSTTIVDEIEAHLAEKYGITI